MRLILLLTSIFIASLAACGAPDTDPAGTDAPSIKVETASYTGDWAGILKIPGGTELRLILHITENAEDGSYGITMDVPQQGATGLEGENARIDDAGSFIAEFNDIGASVNLKRKGETLTGAFLQGLPLPITFEPAGALPGPSRSQEDALVRDYEIREVTFPGGAEGVTLAGELTLPSGDGPYPAVVLISGSGAQDRNEELMEHKPFLILSDYLTRRGYAVLRYDDRGTAESTGDFGASTTQDFANDAAAALAFLREQPGIDPERAGYIGHSEGGYVAPLATQIEPADFMVFLAGPSQTLPEVILRQSVDLGKAAGARDAQLAKQTELQEKLFETVRNASNTDAAFEAAKTIISDSKLVPSSAVEAQAKRMTSPWMTWMIAFDPKPVIAAYDGPVLALYGGKDLQVAPDANVADMEAALTHLDSVVKTLPGLNHLFQPAETGAMTEYYDIETTFDEGAMEEIAAWLDSVT